MLADTEKDARQAEYLANRLRKNERNLRRWASKADVHAFRLYDRDIPEIPLAIDLYRCEEESALVMYLYERPYEKSEEDESAWLSLMAAAAAEATGVHPRSVFQKLRKRMKGEDQYSRQDSGASTRQIRESGLLFKVNLSDYLDTGLFLDHRPARGMVRSAAAGRSVLNLFAYTGAFSVYAAAGGATRVTTVDLSNTYLDWAEENAALNGFSPSSIGATKSDVMTFLSEAERRKERWDIIIADPPTYSNSKSTRNDFDVQRDWPGLVRACVDVLAPGGCLLFSSNSRSLRWDGSSLTLPWADVTEQSLPPDFRNRKIHRCWLIGRPGLLLSGR